MILLKESTDFNNFQILTEERNGKKDLYIKDIFAQLEVKNCNDRFV